MKRCFDLRANLISIKVSTSHRKSTQVRAMLGQTESQVFNLRLLVTPFGQGFTSLLDQRTAQLLNRVTLRGCQDYLAVLAQITFWREKVTGYSLWREKVNESQIWNGFQNC